MSSVLGTINISSRPSKRKSQNKKSLKGQKCSLDDVFGGNRRVPLSSINNIISSRCSNTNFKSRSNVPLVVTSIRNPTKIINKTLNKPKKRLTQMISSSSSLNKGSPSLLLTNKKSSAQMKTTIKGEKVSASNMDNALSSSTSTSTRTVVPVAVPFPPWMFQPLQPLQLEQMVIMVCEEKRRKEMSKKVVVAGATVAVTTGVLGHMYLLKSSSHLTTGCEEVDIMLDTWFNALDMDLQNLIRCTVTSSYQVEEDSRPLAVCHNLGVSSVGHGLARPVVEDSVKHMLSLDYYSSLLEAGLAEACGLSLIQGYFALNDIRRCRKGELTSDERNLSLSKRAGIVVGASIGQTMAMPVGETALLVTSVGLTAICGVATGPAFVGGAIVGGSVWLASSVIGGVLGSKAGKESYRALCPLDRVKDAREYFGLRSSPDKNDMNTTFSKNDSKNKIKAMIEKKIPSSLNNKINKNGNRKDTSVVDIITIERRYRRKINEIIKSTRNNPNEPIDKNNDSNKIHRLIFQCNRHLAWLLEGECAHAMDVLGIEKKSIANGNNN